MSLAIELLFVLLVAIASAAGGYFEGDKHASDACKATEAKRLQDEAIARESELRRGEKASGAFQAEALQQRIDNDQLTRAFNDYKRHHPILARRPLGPVTSAAAAASAPAEPDQVPAGDSPALSLGAVWMWNSALFNRDAPAGACGLADTSEGACAADSGVTLEDAWDNQALNARTCAEDRLRYQRLIDFLNGRK